MPDHRYDQFCPIARAAELLGERWTLLILRELFCGPQRFTDLRRRLPGISTSILTERLARLEERGISIRREIPPPTPATLHELTPLGRELEPVLTSLVRFGVRLLEAPRLGDHIEPEWLPMALGAFTRTDATPERRIALRIPNEGAEVALCLVGGPGGTRLAPGTEDADVTVRLAPLLLLALASGQLDPDEAAAAGQIEVEGDTTALRDLPALLDLNTILARPNPAG